MKTNIRKQNKNNNKIFGGKISMKNNIKKTLSIILAIITIFSITSITSFATEELDWTVATQDMLVLSEDGTTITGYTDKLSGNIEIPDKIDGTAIIKIAKQAFEGCKTLKAIKIPQNMKEISYHSFRNCTNLGTIVFNAINCTINSYSNTSNYDGCNKLTTFIFGKGVTAIPANVCYGANKLTEVVFDDVVTKIGSYAFANCSSLDYVDISNVTTIGNAAFYNCSEIDSFVFSDNLKKIGETQVSGMKGVFEGCSIEEIIIPEKVEYIGCYTFKNCANLKTIVFNATNCAVSSFYPANNYEGCNNLTKFVFGKEVTEIPDYVCYGADTLTEVVFDDVVTKIGDYAFADCSILEKVKYAGTEKDKAEIVFGKNNDYLKNAEWICKVELIDAENLSLNYKGSVSIDKVALKNIDVTYESSSPEIITVDAGGTITAVGTGTATITATATIDGEAIEDEVTVTSSYSWWQLIINIVLFGWLWY